MLARGGDATLLVVLSGELFPVVVVVVAVAAVVVQKPNVIFSAFTYFEQFVVKHVFAVVKDIFQHVYPER